MDHKKLILKYWANRAKTSNFTPHLVLNLGKKTDIIAIDHNIAPTRSLPGNPD